MTFFYLPSSSFWTLFGWTLWWSCPGTCPHDWLDLTTSGHSVQLHSLRCMQVFICSCFICVLPLLPSFLSPSLFILLSPIYRLPSNWERCTARTWPEHSWRNSHLKTRHRYYTNHQQVYWMLCEYTDRVYLRRYTEQVYWENTDVLYSAVHSKAGCQWPLQGQKGELCWQCSSTVHHLSSL